MILKSVLQTIKTNIKHIFRNSERNFTQVLISNEKIIILYVEVSKIRSKYFENIDL